MSEVPLLYKEIIHDVIDKVRNDFIHMGIDEQVLHELQDIWVRKLLETKIFSAEEFGADAKTYFQDSFNQAYLGETFLPNFFEPKTGDDFDVYKLPQEDGATEGKTQDELLESENESENELGSDLDDEDELDEVDDPKANIILCQYDKVTRTKNRWRCTLKDGIMHLNGKDFLFHRASGEFEW